MKVFRKSLLVALPVVGFAIFIGAHSVDEHSLFGSIGSGLSFLCFLGAIVVAFLPDRHPVTAAVAEDAKPVPRTLSRDVLNDSSLSMTLPQRIEAAIELSKTVSRSLGIVSVRIDDMDKVAERMGVATAEEATAKLSAALRRTLRATDRAIALGPDEILIGLPLIAVRSDLDAISFRLSRFITRIASGSVENGSQVAPLTIDLGIAMYPIDGYRAQDLIESARLSSSEKRAARQPAPLRSHPTDVAPAKPRKPRAPRSRKPVIVTQ